MRHRRLLSCFLIAGLIATLAITVARSADSKRKPLGQFIGQSVCLGVSVKNKFEAHRDFSKPLFGLKSAAISHYNPHEHSDLFKIQRLEVGRGEDYLVGINRPIGAYGHLPWEAFSAKDRVSKILPGFVLQEWVVSTGDLKNFSLPISYVDGNVSPGVFQQERQLVVLEYGLGRIARFNLQLEDAIFEKRSLNDKLTLGDISLMVHDFTHAAIDAELPYADKHQNQRKQSDEWRRETLENHPYVGAALILGWILGVGGFGVGAAVYGACLSGNGGRGFVLGGCVVAVSGFALPLALAFLAIR